MFSLFKKTLLATAVASLCVAVSFSANAQQAKPANSKPRATQQRAKQETAPAKPLLNSVQPNERDNQNLINYAAAGHSYSQYVLALKYYNGAGLPKNEEEAFKWMKLAADNKHNLAQFYLAHFYEKGIGTEKDINKTVEYEVKAAENGVIRAQYSLAARYAFGQEGVTQNWPEAAKWYRMAADKGHVGSQLMMGKLCERGQGVTQNREEAYNWYLSAAMQGNEEAKTALSLLNR